MQSKEMTATDSNLKSVHVEMQKHTNGVGNINENTRDQLAKKFKKGGVPAAKPKPPPGNAPVEPSFISKSQLQDHDSEAERDSSASSVVVRPSMNPRSPKPIKPAVGNITIAEIPYGSAMEEWEVRPGTVKTNPDNLNTRGHGKFNRSHV